MGLFPHNCFEHLQNRWELWQLDGQLFRVNIACVRCWPHFTQWAGPTDESEQRWTGRPLQRTDCESLFPLIRCISSHYNGDYSGWVHRLGCYWMFDLRFSHLEHLQPEMTIEAPEAPTPHLPLRKIWEILPLQRKHWTVSLSPATTVIFIYFLLYFHPFW